MSDEKQVWRVSKGEYSAYEVVALFDNEQAANDFIKSDDHLYVEEPMPVLSTLPDPVPWITINISLSRDLTKADAPIDVSYQETEHNGYPGLTEVPPALHVNRYVHSTRYVPVVAIVVEGTDIDRCRKVASEKRANALAEFSIIVTAERERQIAMQREGALGREARRDG